MTEYLYRYTDIKYAPSLNEWDEPEGRGTVGITLRKYPILAKTPKGAWIEMGYHFADDITDKMVVHKRFVLLTANKRFACPTEKEALESLIARKQRQIRILDNLKEDARLTICLAKKKLDPEVKLSLGDELGLR